MFGGIVSGSHDASVCVIDAYGVIQFASASERFTRVKHCSVLTKSLLDRVDSCHHKVFFEDISAHPQPDAGFVSREDWDVITANEKVDFLRSWRFSNPKFLKQWSTHTLDHHRSHAAASFFTRPWESSEDTVILTMDGIGKDYMTANNIYRYDHHTKEFRSMHSDAASIGVFYSAVAFFLDFDHFEEGSLMALASFGEPVYVELMESLYHNMYFGEAGNQYLMGDDLQFYNRVSAFLKQNIGSSSAWSKEDLASSAQTFLESKVMQYAKQAREHGSKLCYGGGVAQNIAANSLISDLFDDVWIVADPTDSGSSLGAAAWAYALETGNDKINWTDAFLGFKIEREINPCKVVNELISARVCGIANGAAEFGPRALGNRSLLADARADVKDHVNRIKKREAFRPFGAVVLEEEFDNYFVDKQIPICSMPAKLSTTLIQ